MILESKVDAVQEYRMLRAAVSSSRMAMSISDPNQPDNPIVLVNGAFLDMTGYGGDEVLGRNCRFLQGSDTDSEAIEAIRAAIRGRHEIQVELVNYRRDGSPFLNQLVIKPIFDEEGRLVYFFASQFDISAHRKAEALTLATEKRLRLVADELTHRVRNTLSMVQAIVRQTIRNASSLTEVNDVIAARLAALGQAHDALTQHDWERAELGAIVHNTIRPHDDVLGRFVVAGPKVYLGAKSSLAIAMAVHELCTNAIKYGSLSVSSGKVEITWTLVRGQDLSQLTLKWREVGGPLVQAPTRKGFGSILIRESLASDLAGTVDVSYAPTGLVCIIEANLTE